METRMNLFTRRHLLQRSSLGLGTMALGSLLNSSAVADIATNPVAGLGAAHFPARAKSVIYLHMVGAPSHLDLLEHKPTLEKFHGQPCPDNLLTKGQQFAFIRGHPALMGSPFKWYRHGKTGLELSELLPHLGSVADDICVVKSLH